MAVEPGKKEPGPIYFLRSYSNYLTPKAGLFSTDTLAAVANLLRNVYLIQATLVALLVAVLFVPRLLYGLLATLADWPTDLNSQVTCSLAAVAASAGALYVALAFVVKELGISNGDIHTQKGTDSPAVWCNVFIPLAFSALITAALLNEGVRRWDFIPGAGAYSGHPRPGQT